MLRGIAAQAAVSFPRVPWETDRDEAFCSCPVHWLGHAFRAVDAPQGSVMRWSRTKQCGPAFACHAALVPEVSPAGRTMDVQSMTFRIALGPKNPCGIASTCTILFLRMTIPMSDSIAQAEQ